MHLSRKRRRSARILPIILALAATACTPVAEAPAQPPATVSQIQWAKRCKEADEWNRAGPPFRIWGNSWYVGTCGITAILVTSDYGHILIDGGPRDGGALVAKNIEALGFRLRDVKLLLMTHEHHDHVGGLAELQRLTGAGLLSSERAAPVMQNGGKPSSDDPQSGAISGFSPVRVDGFLTDGEAVHIGPLSLTPRFTPGHTPGAVSWQWKSCEGETCRTIVYADSLSPVSADGYRFSDHPDYVAGYRASLRKLAALDCEIMLTPHPSQSAMHARLADGSALVNKAACGDYAQSIGKRLDDRLAKDAGKTQ